MARGLPATLQEFAPFIGGGVAILVGTADLEHVPHAVRGWGATVVDGRSLRLLLPDADAPLWANLASTRRVAACFTDVATYRSIQVKGAVTELPERASDDDALVWEHYREQFFEAVESGSMVPRSKALRLLPAAVRPAVLHVEELFDQTPGPAAGRAIEAADR